MIKPTKTISGVAPVAVMVPPKRCLHGTCLYCPTLNAPQSYTPESPAVLRAKLCNYDAYKQVLSRIKTLNEMKHPTEKIELIIMGGTFLSYPKDFQKNFIKRCYDALNRKTSKSLEEAKKINETAKHRCTALCIETRPDFCSENHIKDILNFGATRVELGVQAIDDDIYKKVNRGHKVKDVIETTRRLKKAGFKVGYHIMPGLPGSNPKKDIKMFGKLFSSEDFQPDQIKIYPCQVLKGAGLESLYYNGEYVPYTKEETKKLVIQIIKLTPRYCRIMRIMREIPLFYLIAGIKNIDLRKDIEDEIRKKETFHKRNFHGSPIKVFLLARNFLFSKKKEINEIRFREIGFAVRDKRKINPGIKIKVMKYSASKGKEYFIEVINKDDIIFGLLRLRLEKERETPAMIREIHVYGPTLDIGKNAVEEYQHKGLGKELIKKAEIIAKKKGRKKIRIISGVGVREYYRKLG